MLFVGFVIYMLFLNCINRKTQENCHAHSNCENHLPTWFERLPSITLVEKKKRKIVIIGTYGSTPNKDEEAENSMWAQQLEKMQKLSPSEQATDHKEQYIQDLNTTITRMKDENYQVIIAGNININLHKQTAETRTWEPMMRNNHLRNTICTYWPNIKQKFNTWGGESWIDHIYI